MTQYAAVLECVVARSSEVQTILMDLLAIIMGMRREDPEEVKNKYMSRMHWFLLLKQELQSFVMDFADQALLEYWLVYALNMLRKAKQKPLEEVKIASHLKAPSVSEMERLSQLVLDSAKHRLLSVQNVEECLLEVLRSPQKELLFSMAKVGAELPKVFKLTEAERRGLVDSSRPPSGGLGRLVAPPAAAPRPTADRAPRPAAAPRPTAD